MSANQAAWMTASATPPLKVDSSPVPKPGPGELLIKNHAVAINPVDWKIQQYGGGEAIKAYPFILGEDATGTIEEVGEGVTKFHKGQRVIAHLLSLKTKDAAYGGFQLYTLATENLTAAIPDSLSFEQAVVLPLGLSTAATGLYVPSFLGLPLPSTNPTPSGKTILIWGGASSVGANAIQLAAASGVKVITTASPANFAFVKSLGASVVFDYRSPSVVQDILNEIKDSPLAGIYDAIAEDKSFAPLIEITNQTGPLKIASVLPYVTPTETFSPKFIWAWDIAFADEKIGQAVWGDFVPKALASGKYQAKPDPVVVGKGLGEIQHAYEVQKAGVSAKKVVVTLV